MARAASIPQHDPAARLAAFNRVSTASVDAAADAVGRIFCPHRLTPEHRTSPDFFALHNSALFGGLSVNYVAYGGSVSIDPGQTQALRAARARAGWSRETLAHHSGVSWSAIAQIESGRRRDVRLSSLSALADALGVSVDELFRLEGEK